MAVNRAPLRAASARVRAVQRRIAASARRAAPLRLARARCAGALAALAVLATQGAHAEPQAFDPAHTRIGFELRTRWGQRLDGRFPSYEGQVRRHADGLQQVTVRLSTADVEIVGYPRYTAFSRGPSFFDAQRYPTASFTSEPYPESLLVAGGRLGGTLRLHGVSQRESFTVEPSTCARPAIDCDLVARGSVRREDYGMDDWAMAVQGRVQFALRLRLKAAPTP